MKKIQNRKIIVVLKDLQDGMTMETLSKKYGISKGTVSKWNKKYSIDGNFLVENDNVSIKDGNFLVENDNVSIKDGNVLSNVSIYEEDYDPDYDYNDDANDLLEEYFKTHNRDDVSGIYFDENGKLKLKKEI